MAAGTSRSSGALAASGGLFEGRAPRSVAVGWAAPTWSRVVAGGEVDDGAGRQRRDEHDQSGEPPAERATGLAEEHDDPPVRARSVELGVHLHDVHRVGDVLQVHAPAVAVVEPGEPAGESARRLGQEHLAPVGTSAEPGGDVERRSAEGAVGKRDGLTGVDSDPDRERKVGLGQRLLLEQRLEVDRGADRLPRGREHRQRLVAAQLDQLAAVCLHLLGDEVGELARQLGGRLVPVLVGEPRVPPDVGDEECSNVGLGGSHDP